MKNFGDVLQGTIPKSVFFNSLKELSQSINLSSMGKSQGTPLLAAGGIGPASPAYGCVKPRLAFSLESPLDESGGQAPEIKLKSFPSEAPGRFTFVTNQL